MYTRITQNMDTCCRSETSIFLCANDQRDAQFLYQILFHSFYLLCMFRTNLVVHHQQHCIIYCITQFGTIGTLVLSGESS